MAENQALAVIERTKQALAERGINPATWNVLTESLYPGANPASVMLVWDYCLARNLDPMKKPVHIVPMRLKVGDTWQTRDQVLPGIYEYRITAHRTGEYLGHDEPMYGPEIEAFGVKAPEWCKYTVYRWNEKAKLKVPYTVTVKFKESCGTKKEGNLTVANGRWERAPVQMLTKCAEAAALREAFPEEIGGTPTVEEIEDHMPDVIDVTGTVVDAKPQAPPGVDNFMKLDEALRDKIERGFAALKMSQSQRLVKINQYFAKPSLPLAEVGEMVLVELVNAFNADKPKETSNAKTRAAQPDAKANPTAAPGAPGPAEGKPGPGTQQEVPAGEIRGGSTAPGNPAADAGRTAAPAVQAESSLKSADIPWGGAKPATNPKDVSEYF